MGLCVITRVLSEHEVTKGMIFYNIICLSLRQIKMQVRESRIYIRQNHLLWKHVRVCVRVFLITNMKTIK